MRKYGIAPVATIIGVSHVIVIMRWHLTPKLEVVTPSKRGCTEQSSQSGFSRSGAALSAFSPSSSWYLRLRPRVPPTSHLAWLPQAKAEAHEVNVVRRQVVKNIPPLRRRVCW